MNEKKYKELLQDDIQLEVMDWKAVEQHSEEALRKQLVDLEITKKVRIFAKSKILALGGQTSGQEKRDAIKSLEKAKNTITG